MTNGIQNCTQVSQVRQVNDETLLKNTKALAAEERRITLEILHHLQEIYRRRLFAGRGFGSLFEYATRELGYSDAAAQRRIAAMKLLTDIPEIEEQIKTGSISLSNAAQAQKLFQSEAKLDQAFTVEAKKEILASLEHKSSREAERELIQHASQPISIQKPDRVKPVAPAHSEIRFIADQVLLDQLDKVRGLLANKFPHLSLAELISEMAKLSIEKLQPKAPKEAKVPNEEKIGSSKSDSVSSSTETAADSDAGVESRYIPVQIKRRVYHRDQGKCQYLDPVTRRKCHSTHAVQCDHVIPYAMGGPTTVDNLQLKCRMHNQYKAIQQFGEKKMSAYVKLK